LVRPVIDWGDGESVVLCDAVTSIDPERRLGKEVGYVTFTQMQEIDRALKFLLDLP
jgi:mRNA-degrading endonuclease toxin of MazEF toxin-antitoxin module